MKNMILSLIFLSISLNAISCMLVAELDSNVKSNIEDIAIFWDEEDKYENHIRQIDMQTSGNSVAFIVPLPSVPKVYEVREGLFKDLSKRLIPITITNNQWNIGNFPIFFYTVILGKSFDRFYSKANDFAGSLGRSKGIFANSVSVLQETHVAGFDVKTIMATDIEGLEVWLKDHGFPFQENHREWLSYYIQKKWPLTIFHFSKKNNDNKLVTKTIGLGFATETPIHPYKEPKRTSKGNGSREFKVYFFANHMVDARLENNKPWSGNVLFSSSFQPEKDELLGLPIDTEKKYFMTVFSEDRIDRGNDPDIIFKRSNKNKIINNLPPIIRSIDRFFPFDLVLILFWSYRKRDKLKKASIAKKMMYVSLWYIVSFAIATAFMFVSI